MRETTRKLNQVHNETNHIQTGDESGGTNEFAMPLLSNANQSVAQLEYSNSTGVRLRNSGVM